MNPHEPTLHTSNGGRSYLAIFLAVPCLVAHASTELVMHDEVTIEAKSNSSSIKITAGKGFDRAYEWDGCTLKSNMNARKQRWFGSMGIYDPSPFFGLSFHGCKGIARTVVQEGQIHFDDPQFAYEWIRRHQKAYPRTVWTNDGVLISWDTTPGRVQLSTDVWLICIDGKRPKSLVGATDSAVTILANPVGQGIRECTAVGKDVVLQTRSQLEKEWKSVDEWIARRNARTQGFSK